MSSMKLPIIPIRNRVLFPFATLRLTLGRPASLSLVRQEFRGKNAKRRGDTFVGVVTVHDGGSEARDVTATDSDEAARGTAAGADVSDSSDELYSTGCLARVVKLTSIKKGETQMYSMWVEGLARITILRYVKTSPYRVAAATKLPNGTANRSAAVEAMALNIRRVGIELLEALKAAPSAVQIADFKMENALTSHPERLAFVLLSVTNASVADKMTVLETDGLEARLRAALVLLTKQVEVAKMFTKIRSEVASQLKTGQRRFYLRQQLRAIQKELGEGEGEEAGALQELEDRLEAAELPPAAEKMAHKELRRLKRMNTASPEYSMVVTYLEWLADLPWGRTSGVAVGPTQAKAQLDHDHAGLENVKRRMVEFLAVRQLNPNTASPIVLLVGPPGVGKTSLGRSVATALGRKFHRVSLGGLRDVAEIRGHRRTYIGSMPGLLVQTLKRAGTADPVILMDEIDKLGQDFRGDPGSALLEVLDPEQNCKFADHYLGLPVDLSKVLFLATANTTDTIPPAVLDRMEVIRLPGYTVTEKVDIAKRYLWPKQMKEHGLTGEHVQLRAECFRGLIEHYTREAGVRTLERKLAALCRRVAVLVATHMSEHATGSGHAAAGSDGAGKTVGSLAEDAGEADGTDSIAGDLSAEAANGAGDTVDPSSPRPPSHFKRVEIDDAFVGTVLGPHLYELEVAATDRAPGVVTGLAWTAAGGRLLFVEATKMAGSGRLRLTGQLGDVMKESAHTALSWIRSRAEELGLPARPVQDLDIHVHFPAGAIPKDGPSAGIAITTALVSMLTMKAVRPDTAMTGEVTLRGAVLPVGGIKEKLLGAHRGGVRRVILSARNEKDLADVPSDVLGDMEVVLVKNMREVLEHVFELEAGSVAVQQHAEWKGLGTGRSTLKRSDEVPPPATGSARACMRGAGGYSASATGGRMHHERHCDDADVPLRSFL